jgi:hypothetical protein
LTDDPEATRPAATSSDGAAKYVTRIPTGEIVPGDPAMRDPG